MLDAQPTVVMYPFGLAMVHNGNVVNFNQLKQTLCEDAHRLLDTSNDVALILYALAAALETKNLKTLTPDDIFDSVQSVQEKVQGAYSALTIIAGHGLLAFTDPHGIRPLVLGRKYTDRGMVYAFASETDCFDYLGFELIRDLRPGEAVLIDNDGNVHSRICRAEKQAFCVFEYIYFAREDSVINGRAVATERMRIGRQAGRAGEEGRAQAGPRDRRAVVGLLLCRGDGRGAGRAVSARAGEEQPRRAQLHRAHAGAAREDRAPEAQSAQGRGARQEGGGGGRLDRARHDLEAHRQAAARMRRRRNLFHLRRAADHLPLHLRHRHVGQARDHRRRTTIPSRSPHYLEADAVIYQSLDDLRALYHDLPCCYACFSGEYPTGASEAMVKQIEEEKECSSRD